MASVGLILGVINSLVQSNGFSLALAVYPLLSLLLLLGIVSLFNMATAPSRLYSAAQTEARSNERLKLSKLELTTKNQVTDKLSKIHEKAVSLLTKKLANDTELEELKKLVKEWQANVTKWIAKNMSKPEARLFYLAGAGEPMLRYDWELNKDHRMLLHGLNHSAKYLKQLIEKLDT